MEKTGEVRIEVTPCDVCGNSSTVLIGTEAFCDTHKPAVNVGSVADKMAEAGDTFGNAELAALTHLKSFTTPLEEEV